MTEQTLRRFQGLLRQLHQVERNGPEYQEIVRQLDALVDEECD